MRRYESCLTSPISSPLFLAARLGQHLSQIHSVSFSYSGPALPISYFLSSKAPIHSCERDDHTLLPNIHLRPVLFHRKKMTTVRTLEEEEGGSRIFSHPKLKTWSLSLPQACPLATFCFAAFFARALIKHDLCPRLPLARIYCITSKKTIKIFGTHIYPYFGNTTIIERPIQRS